MKLYYYQFNLDGTISKEVLKARKNKSEYAVDHVIDYDTLGKNCMLDSTRYFSFDKDRKIECGPSCYCINGCYMYSSVDIDITEEMKEFAQKRSEIAKQVRELEDEYRECGKNLSAKLQSIV